MTDHKYSVLRPRGYHLRRRLRRLLARCAVRMTPRDTQQYKHLGILTYHRLVPTLPSCSPPPWAVTPERFAQQLSELRQRGFRPLALTEALRAFCENREVPPQSFVVTFDDGYENNYLHAAPILTRLCTPATIFLSTQYVDACEPFPFDDWLPARTRQAPAACWRPLTRDQCLRLRETGLVELGSHTHSHQNFLQRPAELKADLTISYAFLRDQFSIDSPSFSFPFGATNPALISVVRSSGARCALTTCERRVARGDDSFQWGRFNVEHDDDGATLAAKLDGRYTALRNQVRRWMVFGIASRGNAASIQASLPPAVLADAHAHSVTASPLRVAARFRGLGATDDDHNC